jgi:hypothetical protein
VEVAKESGTVVTFPIQSRTGRVNSHSSHPNRSLAKCAHQYRVTAVLAFDCKNDGLRSQRDDKRSKAAGLDIQASLCKLTLRSPTTSACDRECRAESAEGDSALFKKQSTPAQCVVWGQAPRYQGYENRQCFGIAVFCRKRHQRVSVRSLVFPSRVGLFSTMVCSFHAPCRGWLHRDQHSGCLLCDMARSVNAGNIELQL